MKYGFYQTSVNPVNEHDNLAGFGSRDKKAETLGPSELFLKILWLSFNETSDLIFVSLDTLYFPREITGYILGYLEQNYQINASNVIFNASHTHSAPSSDLDFFGEIDGQYVELIKSYIIDGLTRCHANLSVGLVSIQSIQLGSKLFVNRRKIGRDIRSFFLKKRTIMLPNFEKDVCNDIVVISIYDGSGQIKGLVYNFSCHPVFNTSDIISSDFVGTISKNIENDLSIFSMFIQGFAGDIRPNYVLNQAKLSDSINYVKLLFNDMVFKPADKDDFNSFCKEISTSIASCVLNHLDSKTELLQNDKLSARLFSFDLISQSGKTVLPLKSIVALYGSLLIVAISAEVLSSYYFLLKARYPQLVLMPIGYIDGLIGYLPSPDEINDGGYEVSGSPTNYGWDSVISQESLIEYTSRLVEEIDTLLKVVPNE